MSFYGERLLTCHIGWMLWNFTSLMLKVLFRICPKIESDSHVIDSRYNKAGTSDFCEVKTPGNPKTIRPAITTLEVSSRSALKQIKQDLGLLHHKKQVWWQQLMHPISIVLSSGLSECTRMSSWTELYGSDACNIKLILHWTSYSLQPCARTI